MFTEAAITRFPETHWVLLHRLEDVIQELRALNADPAPFPTTNDPLVHFNAYVDFGISTYAAKFFQFFESIEYAIENQIYLIYAQSGRALLENIATLRYYSLHPDLADANKAWKSKTLTDKVLRKAAFTLDRFIRGNRFSWGAFIEGRFAELTKTPDQEHLAQINSTTCLQKLFKDSPALESIYDLFCDLVHPNLGSNFLVLGVLNDSLVAGAKNAKDTSLFIVSPTLAAILGSYEIAKTAIRTLAAQRFFPHAEGTVH